MAVRGFFVREDMALTEHIGENCMLDFLSDNLSIEDAQIVKEHLSECDECLDRLNGLVYLKKNYNKLTQEINLHEIMKLQAEVSYSNPDTKSNKILSFHQRIRKKIWIPVSTVLVAAATVIFVLFNQSGTTKEYDEWVKAGVLASNDNLDEPIDSNGMEIMLARLAGVSEMNANLPEGELTARDGATAIKDYFKLADGDYSKMLDNINADEKLTYEVAINLIDNFAGGLYNKDAAMSTIEDNYAINTAGAYLKDVNIPGNLYVMQGIGSGEVTLDHVAVQGQIYVLGGGMASVVLKDSQAAGVYVNKDDGKVRVYAKGTTKVNRILLESGAKLQNDNNSDAFKSVGISEAIASGSELVFHGYFSKVAFNSADIKLLLENGEIDELTVDKNSTSSKVEVSDSAVINKFIANAAVTVEGNGLLKEAEINAEDVKLNIEVEKINNTIDTTGQEPEKLFDAAGHALNNLDSDPDQLKQLFIERYAKEISKARAEGKAIEIEGFVFFPDEVLTNIISETTGNNYFDGIKEIGGFGSPGRVDELAELEALKDEKDLESPISGVLVEKVQSFSGMEYLKNMRELKLINVTEVDFSPIESMKELKSLSIQLKPDRVIDLTPITRMTSVEKLVLVGYFSKKDNLKELSDCSWVKSLTMYGFDDLKDMYFLKGMKSLEEINFRFVSARNPEGVEVLKELKNLKKMVMQEMTGWIPYMYYAPSLEDITINFGYDIDYISMLSKMPNLKRASFGNNNFLGVDNWEGVLSMNNLEYLSVSGGRWLSETEMRQVIDAYHELKEEEQTESKFRELESQAIKKKKVAIEQALPNCQIEFGTYDKMDVPK